MHLEVIYWRSDDISKVLISQILLEENFANLRISRKLLLSALRFLSSKLIILDFVNIIAKTKTCKNYQIYSNGRNTLFMPTHLKKFH